MDPIPIKTLKFQANQKLNKHQKNQSLVINLCFYCLAVLSCCVFCSAPLWYPSFFYSMKVFSQMVSSAFLSSKFVFILGNLIVVALVGESKIFSTMSSQPNIHLEYEENIKRCQRFNLSSTHKEINEPLKVMKYVVEARVVVDETSLVEEMVVSSCEDGDQAMEEGEGCEEESMELVVVDEVKEEIDEKDEEIDEEDEEVNFPEEEQFNRRADDFIARVNERRRYELLLCNLE